MRSRRWGVPGQGQTECRHRTLKNRILLENDFAPAGLDRLIEAFVEQRYHASLDNSTPA